MWVPRLLLLFQPNWDSKAALGGKSNFLKYSVSSEASGDMVGPPQPGSLGNGPTPLIGM